jgi:hypothetical protein
VSILTLTRKDGGYSAAPDFLDRAQNARLVIHEHIVLGRVTPLDVIQRLFFVDIDEHVAVCSFEGSLDPVAVEAAELVCLCAFIHFRFLNWSFPLPQIPFSPSH